MKILTDSEFKKAHTVIPTHSKAEFIEEARKIGYDVRYSGKSKMFYVNQFDAFSIKKKYSLTVEEKCHVVTDSLYGSTKIWTTDFIKTSVLINF